jgi:hypothetical protein
MVIITDIAGGDKMLDINVSYQAKVFGNFTDIGPTPENTIKILTLFKEYGYLPGTIQEISNKPTPRLRLSSPDQEWSFFIGSNQIVIEKNLIDVEKDDNIDNFIFTACKIFKSFLEEFSRKGSRIALITAGMLSEMKQDQLENILERVAKPFGLYNDNKPFEWNVRYVSKAEYDLNGIAEKINLITALSRKQGEIKIKDSINDFDRIWIDFDFNTVADNVDFRFDYELISLFFKKAIETRIFMLSKIKGVIYD